MTKESKKNNAAMGEMLNGILADTYQLAIKAHGFHWNVTGLDFPQLHAFFETQYTEAFTAADEIAERVRALSLFVPAGCGSFAARSHIKDSAKPLSAKQMLQQLLADHEHLAEHCHEGISLADDLDDEVSEDLLIGRKAAHDKTAWMLRAMLEK